MRRSAMLGILLLAAMLAVAAPAQASPSCTWAWTDLPVPSHMRGAQVYASDGHGTYVGSAWGDLPMPDEAVLWRNGTVTSLGAAFGASTRVWDVNIHGVVVGEAGGAPVRYRSGQWERLPLPAGYRGIAMHINDNGDIFGAYSIGRAIRWPASGSYELLTSPYGGTYVEPTGIAQDGTVIIWTNMPGGVGRNAGFLRAPGGTWIQVTPADPTASVSPTAINDDVVVGNSLNVDGKMTATEWDRTGAVVRTYSDAYSLDVNSVGQILGTDALNTLTIWRAGAMEAQLPAIGGYPVRGVAIDEDGAVAGQTEWTATEASRPVLARCG